MSAWRGSIFAYDTAVRWFDGIRQDLLFAARLLLRNPGFTAAVTAALGLAIGANVTVFTLANAFLFKNLPFDDSDRIVYVSSTNAQRPGRSRPVSYPDYRDLREQVKAFEGAGLVATGSVDLSDSSGLPELSRSAQVTAGAFAVIGQRPLLGRDFTADDERPGAPAVVILGDALWRGRYARDPGIIGRTIRINDINTTIVGVMRPGITFPGTSDLWLPLRLTPTMEQRRNSRSLTMFARLATGATLRAANAQVSVVAARLAETYPATNKEFNAIVQNFNDRYNSGDTGRLMSWLLWAVAFVMLIACANVANLLLSRAIVRSREISIRASLGAGRWQVIRQLFVESLMLAMIAGAFGAALGFWGVRVFEAALVPAVKPAYIDFSVDGRVVLYLLAVTFGSAVFFGLVPALQLSRVDINAVLKGGAGAVGQSPRARALSAGLVVVEVALAVVLLVGAGLMIRSFVNTTRADIGIDARNVLSFSVNLRPSKYPQPDDHVRFYDALKPRLEALPGVATVAVASDLPAESPDEVGYEIEGAPLDSTSRRPRAMSLYVGEDYFRALGLRPRRGREFSVTDTPATPPLVIVNESFAQRSWRGQDAVGRRIRVVERDGEPLEAAPWLQVAGVVPDVLQDDESFVSSPVIYLAHRQHPDNGVEVLVRTTVPPASLGESIRREVQALDGDLAVRGMRPLEESLWLRNWRYRVFGSMFGIFAVIAMVLASVGLSAVMAHSVSQRTRELGVRRALGASTRTIVTLIAGQAARRFGGGLLLGLVGAWAATGVLESQLVGVQPGDPATFATVALVLALAAVLGCAIPARRATQVDPLVALRTD
jgi:predicted permease